MIEALAREVSTWHDDLRLIDSAPLPRVASRPIRAAQVIVADKGFAGREFERFITDRLVAELAPRPPPRRYASCPCHHL
ncbi:hypothetical protein [Streptomyces sp. NPDC058954]|uniref:hypothetical protein n=1 Tax=Streptomyces sp. NPDC058954 TaxID=3346677 RepID=UPI0036D0EA2D